MYLHLLRRVDEVAKWANLGTSVMKEAREQLGLSYETVARKIPVAAKTYERYEKAGRVPQVLLPQFAEALNLKIERAMPITIEVPDASADDGDVSDERWARLEQAVGELQRDVRAVLRAVAPEEPPAAASAQDPSPEEP